MTFRAPADEVVFDSDPTAATSMLGKRGMVRVGLDSREPWDWTTTKPTTRMAGRSIAAWEAFGPDPMPHPEGGRPCILFMRELRSSNGVAKLVVVRGYFLHASSNDSTAVLLESICQDVQPWFKHETASSPLVVTGPMAERGLVGHLRFFAGQTDPSDPSRLTLPFELNQKRGLIEAKLQDDGALKFAVPEQAGGVWTLEMMFY